MSSGQINSSTAPTCNVVLLKRALQHWHEQHEVDHTNQIRESDVSDRHTTRAGAVTTCRLPQFPVTAIRIRKPQDAPASRHCTATVQAATSRAVMLAALIVEQKQGDTSVHCKRTAAVPTQRAG